MIIRNERDSNIVVISEITIAAFQNHPYSNHNEQFIINGNALVISLVAEIEGQVVDHIAFSPVTISDGECNGHDLGPVSVVPEFQKRGIGSALICEVLSLLKARRSKGCALVGDQKDYERFEFRNIPDLIHKGVSQEYFLTLAFGNDKTRVFVKFQESFNATS